MRILFVDDNADLRLLMPLLLKKRGYTVRTAETATEALLCAPEFAPNIVLSDISMPEMDGYDFIARLREQSVQSFCCVALTGFGAPADIARARDAGFDECLTKPLDVDRLYLILEKFEAALSADELKHIAPSAEKRSSNSPASKH